MLFSRRITNDYMDNCMALAQLAGILPDSYLLNSKKASFRHITLSIAVFSLILEFTQLLINSNTNFIFEEFVRSVCVTVLHFISIAKTYILKSKLCATLFDEVKLFELEFYKTANSYEKAIYTKHVVEVQKTTKYYFAGVVILIIAYVPAPLFKAPYEIVEGNQTIFVPIYPMASYTPFKDSYWSNFAWIGILGAFQGIFLVVTDVVPFTFIQFAICQLNIIRHNIMEIDTQSKIYASLNGCSRVEAFKVLQKHCIIKHQQVIGFVRKLSDLLKYGYLIDTWATSIQLAALFYQLLINFNVIQCCILGHFCLTLLSKAWINISSADRLKAISTLLADDWYQLDWIQLPKNVQNNVKFCIMRAQRPLCLTMGGIETVTLTIFVGTIKASYSYLMLLLTI